MEIMSKAKYEESWVHFFKSAASGLAQDFETNAFGKKEQ